jgi:hypothetical protein
MGVLRLVDRVIRKVLAVGVNPGVGRVGVPGLGSLFLLGPVTVLVLYPNPIAAWWDVVLRGRLMLFSLSTTIRRVPVIGRT